MPTLYEAARAFLDAEKTFRSMVAEPTFAWRTAEQALRQARIDLEYAVAHHAAVAGLVE